MNYFLYVGHSNTPKNKLQEAIQEFVRTIDRKIVKGDRLFEFEILFNENITLINQAHKRCSPETGSFRKHHLEKDMSQFIGNISVHLYAMNEEDLNA